MEVKVFLVTVNMIVDKFSRVITFHNINGIWTISVIIKNSLGLTGNLLVDCETLTPYPLIRNMDNTGILYIPLGRDICEDPIFIMCIKLSQEQPCRCNREGYKPPILSILCSGNNFQLMITHFYDLRNRILQVFINKKLLECAITTIQLTFEDKLVEKAVAFIDCDTKKQMVFRAGASREIIVAFPLKGSLCLTNESTLGDLCVKHAKDFPCRCAQKRHDHHTKMEILCLGNDTERIIKSYNVLQKEFRRIEGWEVRFEQTYTLLSFPEMPRLIEPLGFCKNSTTFDEIIRDDRIAMQIPVGIDVCGRTIESICDYYPLKAPCKCDLTKVKKNSKAVHFECEGSNISSIIDTYNEAQTELTKVQMTNQVTEYNFTKWTIINTTVLDVEIGDCSTLRKIKPVKQTKNAQEFIIPVGVQTCPTNTKGFCTTISERQPCRCSMVSIGDKIEPNFLCQGLSLSEVLRDSNTLRRELYKLSKKHSDIANYVRVTLEDFRVLPEVYECDTKTMKFKELDGNAIYTKVKESMCTKDMLENGDYYAPEPKQKHPSRIEYLMAGKLSRTYKRKRSTNDFNDFETGAQALEGQKSLNVHRGNKGELIASGQIFTVSKNTLILGVSGLAFLLTVLVASAITMIAMYQKKVSRLARASKSSGCRAGAKEERMSCTYAPYPPDFGSAPPPYFNPFGQVGNASAPYIHTCTSGVGPNIIRGCSTTNHGTTRSTSVTCPLKRFTFKKHVTAEAGGSGGSNKNGPTTNGFRRFSSVRPCYAGTHFATPITPY